MSLRLLNRPTIAYNRADVLTDYLFLKQVIFYENANHQHHYGAEHDHAGYGTDPYGDYNNAWNRVGVAPTKTA